MFAFLIKNLKTKTSNNVFHFFTIMREVLNLVGSQKDTAIEEIFERLTQDIFNATLAKW